MRISFHSFTKKEAALPRLSAFFRPVSGHSKTAAFAAVMTFGLIYASGASAAGLLDKVKQSGKIVF